MNAIMCLVRVPVLMHGKKPFILMIDSCEMSELKLTSTMADNFTGML